MVRKIAQQDIYIFLGPTLSVQTAQQYLPDAHYLPPIQCGDLLALLPQNPKIILMIDGIFESAAAIWHKEILYCMERGVQIYGASSMGALRAAELSAFGMKGEGVVYQQYQQGTLTDDDEVAVLHTPAPVYLCLTDAMVNIRATMTAAVSAGIISHSLEKQIVERAKKTFYQQRSLCQILEDFNETAQLKTEIVALMTWLDAGGYVDVKQQDAMQLLKHIMRTSCTSQHMLGQSIARTVFLRALQRKVLLDHISGDSLDKQLAILSTIVSALPCSNQNMIDETYVHQIWLYLIKLRDLYHIYQTNQAHPELTTLREIASLWVLVEHQIESQHIVARKEVIRYYTNKFRYKNHLETHARMSQWLNSNDMSINDFYNAMKLYAHYSFLILEGNTDVLGICHEGAMDSVKNRAL